VNTSTIECHCLAQRALEGSVEEKLGREWLLTNRRGAFAGGTVIGCPTRRYHGLLVAPQAPPLGRHLLLANMLEKVTCGDSAFEFSSFEFPGAIHPEGYKHIEDFACDTLSADSCVRFVYRQGPVELTKEITLARDADVVRIRYVVSAGESDDLLVKLSPLVAMRDFHALQHQAAEDPWVIARSGGGLWIQNRLSPEVCLFMGSREGEGLCEAAFELEALWWHDFRYRVELDRGMSGGEDLYCPGQFTARGTGRIVIELTAVGFPENPTAARTTAEDALSLTPEVRPGADGDDPIRCQLAGAADQFVVRRGSDLQKRSTTILAGYPWFGDWGRDSFISLEGLLLTTGRFDEAKEVLTTFAGKQHNGLIPNLFNDYGGECSYNSVDASLWFIHAADAYVRRSGDAQAWPDCLADPCRKIVDAFIGGTDFGIITDDRGLLRCGDASTQVTWMDAKVGGVPVTPRHGFPVEVSALWYSAVRTMLERERAADESLADRLAGIVSKIEGSFEDAFWNAHDGCLYDCLGDDGPDAAVRPNQILAVSLPHSPLSPQTRKAVLEKVRDHLLTPYGLRSLSPMDSRYCGRLAGDQAQRDRAYHNGTVWAWLIGPYVEACLRIDGFSADARESGRQMLSPLLTHMSEACLGQISEVFDGDAPHHPRGCFAQAWSVAEVLRMYDETSSD